MTRTFSLSTLPRAGRLLAGLILALAALGAGVARADTSVLTKDGTLYEVFTARQADVAPAELGSRDNPVLALRTTRPDGTQSVEVIPETADADFELPGDIEYEESTRTVFTVYTKFQGIQSDVRFALHRGGAWEEKSLVPSIGFYFSLNPRILVTRQQYVDADADGNPVQKWRSILSLVWWEETSVSQARYAAVFVEDGVLALDSITPYDLNEMTGSAGATDSTGLPLSAYTYPTVHSDPSTNGGVRVCFANLVDQQQHVLQLTFPDDLTKLTPPPGGTSAPAGDPSFARGHTPVGRQVGAFPIDRDIQTPSPVETALSRVGVPTFYWGDGDKIRYIRSDAPAGTPPSTLSLRPDLPVERARSLVRDMAARD